MHLSKIGDIIVGDEESKRDIYGLPECLAMLEIKYDKNKLKKAKILIKKIQEEINLLKKKLK